MYPNASITSIAASIILILLILDLDLMSCKEILMFDNFHDEGYDRSSQDPAASSPSLMQRLIKTRIDPILLVPLWVHEQMNQFNFFSAALIPKISYSWPCQCDSICDSDCHLCKPTTCHRFNWRMSRMNWILEIVDRCLHSPFCQRMVQHADLVTYERNWKRRNRFTDRTLSRILFPFMREKRITRQEFRDRLAE